MASKILTGDVPELMENILNNITEDFHYSLFSCALVSRHWCKMSIPILWREPFLFFQNPLFISNYFSSLDETEKFILKEHGINIEFSKPIFNYAIFLKNLNLSYLEINVKKWIESELAFSKPYDGPLIYHISNLLLKLFIESGVTLHKLDIYFSGSSGIKSGILHSLGRNEQFFSRLQYLSLGVMSEFSAENATALLSILARNATKIGALRFEEFEPDYDPQVIHALIRIIKSQEELKQFNIVGGFLPKKFQGIISALESQKQSLREVIIEGCGYSTEFKMLMNCENLEILRIRYCDYERILGFFDYNINTLEVVDCEIDGSKIALFFEKSGTLLQRLKLESYDARIDEQPLLLESLKSFCPNITYLDFSNIEFSTQLLDLIGNLQRLQYLTLWCSWCTDEIPNEERVKHFAEILPLTLQYFDLRNSCLISFIDILLKNCYAPLKKLIINNLDNKKKVTAVIKFYKRNKSLKYVGVNKYLNLDLDDNVRKVGKYLIVVPYDDIVVEC